MSKKIAIPISFVLKTDLGIEYDKKQLDINCPLCKGKKKLNINIQKNVFRCNKCDASGNAVGLHSLLTEIKDPKKSYKDLLKRYENLTCDEQKVLQKRLLKLNSDEEIKKLYDISTRTEVYEVLLNNLKLSKKHRELLKKRGLSDSNIDFLKYRSCPQKNLDKLGTNVLNEASIKYKKNHSIPGFVITNQNEAEVIDCGSGIMIPIKNWKGDISCFQIRHDEETLVDGKGKYTYFASREKCPVNGCENVHYTFYVDEQDPPKFVYLTEGALKADIAMALGKVPFIAVMGVNNTSQLSAELNRLKDLGLKKVFIAFDMDYREKKEVAKALNKVKKLIADCGLEYLVCEWDEKYKGIDDAFAAKQKIRFYKK